MHLKTMKLNTKLRKTSVPETVVETARESDEDDNEWFDDDRRQRRIAESHREKARMCRVDMKSNRKRKLGSLRKAGRKRLRVHKGKVYVNNKKTQNFISVRYQKFLGMHKEKLNTEDIEIKKLKNMRTAK